MVKGVKTWNTIHGQRSVKNPKIFTYYIISKHKNTLIYFFSNLGLSYGIVKKRVFFLAVHQSDKQKTKQNLYTIISSKIINQEQVLDRNSQK